MILPYFLLYIAFGLFPVFTWCQFYKLGRNRRNDLCGSEELCAGVYTG